MARLERTSERAFVLPIAGFVLFVPPILTVFDGPQTVFGVPLVLLYLFGVWLLLIAAAQRLGRRLLTAIPRRRETAAGAAAAARREARQGQRGSP